LWGGEAESKPDKAQVGRDQKDEYQREERRKDYGACQLMTSGQVCGYSVACCHTRTKIAKIGLTRYFVGGGDDAQYAHRLGDRRILFRVYALCCQQPVLSQVVRKDGVIQSNGLKVAKPHAARRGGDGEQEMGREDLVCSGHGRFDDAEVEGVLGAARETEFVGFMVGYAGRAENTAFDRHLELGQIDSQGLQGGACVVV